MKTCGRRWLLAMGLTLADAESKRWRVEMADKTTHTIEARGFRVECGALVLVQPLGCAAAYAPSTWLTIEEIHDTEG
jgi:hypothetical protein